MNKSKFTLLAATFFFYLGNKAVAQEEFKPSGSPYAKIYSNFHDGLDGESAAFQITRAYFGYKYNMSENFSGHVLLDVGTPTFRINDTVSTTSSLHLTAYLKAAELIYKKGNLQFNFGMIGLEQFHLQEKNWGHRYIEKSFQDLYGFGPSADLGGKMKYKFSEAFSADFTVRNGEGYKNLQTDNTFDTGLGVTIVPVEGLVIRGFYDFISKNEVQTTFSQFIGYQNNKISAGFEYNVQINNRNFKDHNLKGYSAFASYDLTKLFQVFARYDKLSSNKVDGETQNWHAVIDGSLLIVGVQYSPIENVQVALDYQEWMPDLESIDIRNFAYINFQCAF